VNQFNQPPGEPVPADIGALRDEYPDWTIGCAWSAATHGPATRRLWAIWDTFALSAPDAEALAFEIERLTERPRQESDASRSPAGAPAGEGK
jgi:hypothetical protein